MNKAQNKFHGKVDEKGKLHFDATAFSMNLFHFSGSEIVIEIKRHRKTRSLKQNNYYWAVPVPHLVQGLNKSGKMLFDCIPFNEVTAHELIKLIFNTKTTTTLKTTEFEDLMTKVRNWASAELGEYIPLPNEFPYQYDFTKYEVEKGII